MLRVLTSAMLAIQLSASIAFALGEKQIVSFGNTSRSFPLAASHRVSPIFLDRNDWPGVLRAANDFRKDVESVSDGLPEALGSISGHFSEIIIAGTLGRNPVIDRLADEKKIDVRAIRGQWEAALIAVVEHPLPNVDRALVIAGSDKRGTIFGLYTLSEQIGVSPWAWWADVRIPHHNALYVDGSLILPSPAVRYRGIFLNDEAPSLSGWTREKFGGFNHKFYEHVFQLLLRLRANYLWPAMWGSAFNEDDPLNPQLADEYGIVMGTSHHEPMLRAQQEWKRHGKGPWDYTTNAADLNKFWTEGIKRNREDESTITVGMRGDGDMAMSASTNTELLKKIVADQRGIIAENEDPEKHDPQIWALYKEVQQYYEKGMRVPDDVTLLWSDDNWGNLRRVPVPEEQARPGGAGIYYHFDYVGDPRSYKWLNTVPITKVWEQMHLAWEYNANRLWIVNVGDLKPMEFPIEFFLTMARNPNRWGNEDLDAYTVAWATREFGVTHAAEIAALIERYTKYNSRRKPEMIDPETYSFFASGEAGRIEDEWRTLEQESERLTAVLPADEKASYFELVQYPIAACANLGEMYIAAGRNRLYAKQHRASTNDWADRTQQLYERDKDLTSQYHALLGGKWDHMMDQTHIGYTYWHDPPVNTMPAVERITPSKDSHLEIFVDGSADASHSLLAFDPINRQIGSIELALTGLKPVKVAVKVDSPWIRLDWQGETVRADTIVHVALDWSKIKSFPAQGQLIVKGENDPEFAVDIRVLTPPQNPQGFIENSGVVTIDAEHTSRRVSKAGVKWETLPDFGLTRSGIEAFPVSAPTTPATGPQACVAYDFTLLKQGERTLQAILAPTLPFLPGHGLRYSIQLDSQPAQTIDAWAKNETADWAKAVSDGVHRVSTPLGALRAGVHTLNICRVDPGVLLERLLIFGTQPPEYLGPPESRRVLSAK